MYRPSQVLSPAAYRQLEQSRELVAQLFAGLAFLVVIGLCYFFLPVLAPLAGELLGDVISDATQPARGLI